MSKLSWSIIAVLCLTIGLAPFRPPHVAEKTALLLAGGSMGLIDWLDLSLHGFPWVLLVMKAASAAGNALSSSASRSGK